MSVPKKRVSAIAEAAAVSTALLLAAHGAAPSWWSDRGLINPQGVDDDYQAANAGQLKNIATAAYQEMEEALAQFGGAGPAVTAIAQSLVAGDDYAAINQGQLKHVAKPFYDRLIEIGYCDNYLWGAGDQDDWVLMNVGQLKNIFSFDLALDTDSDGMPDWWEEKRGLDVESGVDPSLKAWWPFDEGSGSQALDATGNGYTGTIANPDRYVSGKFASALDFDGVSDDVTVPQPNAVIDGSTFTVSAWVWLDQQANGDYHTVLADLTGNLRGYWLGLDTPEFDGQLEIFWGDGSAYHAVGEDDQSLYRGTWAHAVGTCDGTTKRFYLNGRHVDSDTTPSFAPGLEDDLLIGNDVWGYRWKGKIDEVRIYTAALDATAVAGMYDAVSNPDDDGLSNLEEFQAGTNPWLGDTDLDGLDDGDEVNVHLTDPTDPDTDGDSLTDGDEVTSHGTEPLDPDTDHDWALDGFEVEEGTEPLIETDTPALRVNVNNGAHYATSPDLMLTFPGLAAERVLVAESHDFAEAEPPFENPAAGVAYTLVDQAEGAHILHIRPLRGASPDQEVYEPNLLGIAILDTEPPELTVTSPEHESTTSRPWVRVEGTVSDEVGPARVFVNGQWAEVAADGEFWYSRLMLDDEQNVIAITAQDEAGHTTEQAVTVTLDLNSDTDAPSISFDVPGGAITVGDVETLPIHGTMDDETATVEFTVASGGETAGPFAAQVIGQDIWAEIPLWPGDNEVAVTATDAAGNITEAEFTITRDETIVFVITSPQPYELVQHPDVIVYGVAPENAVVTVNGMDTTPHGEPGGFRTTEPVPLGPFVTDLVATAEKDGQIYYAKLRAKGYEILAHDFEKISTTDSFMVNTLGYAFAHSYNTKRHDWWTVDELLQRYWEDTEGWMAIRWSVSPEGNWIFYPDTFPPDESQEVAMEPPGNGWFGGVVEHTVRDDEPEMEQTVKWRSSQTWFRFGKFVPDVEKQLVVLHFKMMDYNRAPDEPLDPSLITFRGEEGFWYDEAEQEVGFLFEIQIGEIYIIDSSDFTWPACDYIDPINSLGVRSVAGRELSFVEWGNDEVRIEQDYPLWFFEDVDPVPANYHDHVALTVVGLPDDGHVTWEVLQGQAMVTLQGLQDDRSITVTSAERSYEHLDVEIAVSFNAKRAASKRLTVFCPFQARLCQDPNHYPSPGGVQMTSNPFDRGNALPTGYYTYYLFVVVDQFGRVLPYDIPVNEWFGQWQSDWTLANGRPNDENWVEPGPQPAVTGAALAPLHFLDEYHAISGAFDPTPVQPVHPDAGDQVQNVIQAYYAGSLVSGEGRFIKGHTLGQRRGYARQE